MEFLSKKLKIFSKKLQNTIRLAIIPILRGHVWHFLLSLFLVGRLNFFQLLEELQLLFTEKQKKI